jgi:hypothetical protein
MTDPLIKTTSSTIKTRKSRPKEILKKNLIMVVPEKYEQEER